MPDAIETTILRLFMARLDALILTPPVPGDWQVPKFVAPAGPYLTARLLWNRNINRFIGDNSKTEHRGIFQVSVVVPINTGMVNVTNIAGAIAEHFERDTVMTGSGIRVRVEGKPSLSAMMQGPPERNVVPVSIYFHAFA